MKVFVLNDTSSVKRRGRTHDHAGSNATMRELYSLLAGHEIVGRHYAGSRKIKSTIADSDLVICNGEGTMHHDRWQVHLIMDALREAQERGQKTALVNSVWHENGRRYDDVLDRLDFLSFREINSHEASGCRGRIYPDLVFGGAFLLSPKNRRSEICKGNDVGGILNSLPYRRIPVEGSFQECIDLMADCAVYITGQYHGVILAIMTNTPFVAIRGNTPKIEGLVRTAGVNIEVYGDTNDMGERVEAARKRQDAFDVIHAYYRNVLLLQTCPEFLELLGLKHREYA